MCANIVDGKKWRKIYPVRANETSKSFKRCEPLLTETVLVDRFLFGVPLVSPITKQKITKKQKDSFVDKLWNFYQHGIYHNAS